MLNKLMLVILLVATLSPPSAWANPEDKQARTVFVKFAAAVAHKDYRGAKSYLYPGRHPVISYAVPAIKLDLGRHLVIYGAIGRGHEGFPGHGDLSTLHFDVEVDGQRVVSYQSPTRDMEYEGPILSIGMVKYRGRWWIYDYYRFYHNRPPSRGIIIDEI